MPPKAPVCNHPCSSPPLELILNPEENSHVPTLVRAGILGARYLARRTGQNVTNQTLSTIFGVTLRTTERIVTSKQVHTRHNIPDSGPEPRGPTRDITRQETATVGSYLDNADIEAGSAPWHEIFAEAGVKKDNLSGKTLKRAMREDEDIGSYKAAVKEELPPYIKRKRLDWCKKQLQRRPHSKDWRNIVFCDEIHFTIGRQSTKWVKRRKGQRFRPNKIQRKKDARAEPSEFKMLHAFIIIRYNYKK